ncbi:MAG TPA: PSD1 and planctomycete cytochrome C domain-containing protein [Planctomycetota bacterium]|nr:PSD1 and planctomycete cytochrome C domain-containing protein [Planctomycetota bacterium]
MARKSMFQDLFFLGCCVLGAPALPAPHPEDPGAAAEASDFFEARVRPVLTESCFGCHGEKKQQAGLRLDSRDGLLRGSDSGPVVVMGDPEKSPMIRAIRHGSDLKMPPKERLTDAAIASLEAWVRMGAPWPAAPPGTSTAEAQDARQTHWAFQPIRDPPPPPLADTSRGASLSSPIDRFIGAKLEENGLALSRPADRGTLLRRASFGLTGLPPAPDEVVAFEGDDSPEAFARVVDRLLASPRHGERWARHWLDVARYSDTKGYVFQEERRFPYAYTYRDYVIRAFNEDLPYDRFIIEQVAADLLPREEDRKSLAAMGFLTLGRRFLNNKADIIDDRIDVVTRGIMGLTVTCARCHDHKYDPIPTADYYSLYGVLASAVEPRDLPLIARPAETEGYAVFEKELQKREAEVEKFVAEKRTELLGDTRKRLAEYLTAAATRQERDEDSEKKRSRNLVAGELHPLIVGRWRRRLEETRKAHDPIFAPWNALAALGEDFADRAPAIASEAAAGGTAERPINPLIAKAFAGSPPASIRDAADRYAAALIAADGEAPAEPADPAREALRQALRAEGAPANIARGEVERFFDRAVRNKVRELQKKVEEWKVSSPDAPPRAMSLEEAPEPVNPVIFVRGNPSNRGREVPRQFLEVLSRERKPFAEGSGRLELARRIATKENPLTARVIVNRVWLHHFGAGLVRTPGDFGTRSEPPVHLDLLDYLASRFIEGGWSLKKLHRLILLSSAYQAESAERDDGLAADPENRLLWKFPRRRLDFEALRDSILFVSGGLDEKFGGPSVRITEPPFARCRTLYGFIDRQNLPGLFRTFDFASPDTTNAQRHATTVPQQALFLMNSPFTVEEARRLAAREEVVSTKSPSEKVEQLYRLAYGRLPEDEEVNVALRFVAGAPRGPEPRLDPWGELAQVLLLSNEFAFID